MGLLDGPEVQENLWRREHGLYPRDAASATEPKVTPYRKRILVPILEEGWGTPESMIEYLATVNRVPQAHTRTVEQEDGPHGIRLWVIFEWWIVETWEQAEPESGR